MDDEIGPSIVTLSRSEGSVSLDVEILRCAQHDSMDTAAASHGCLSAAKAKGLSPWAVRCFAAAQHDSAILLLRYRNLRAFRLSSPQRMVMGKFLS
jgi:hypothetical protein